MRKIAIFSSLPPVESGISMYSLRLAKELSKIYDITFFVDKGCKPNKKVLLYGEIVECKKIDKVIKSLKKFDIVLYHFGNNNYHTYMYEIALKIPGVVVLHDFVVHLLV